MAEQSTVNPITVYRLYDHDGALLYIGATGQLINRCTVYAHTKSWWADVESIQLEHFTSRAEASDAEATAIEYEHPRYNERLGSFPPEAYVNKPGDIRTGVFALAGVTTVNGSGLKTRVFDLAAEVGLDSDKELAKAMVVSRSHINRIRRGDIRVTSHFIQGAFRLFPNKTFDEMFYVEEEQPKEVAEIAQ